VGEEEEDERRREEGGGRRKEEENEEVIILVWFLGCLGRVDIRVGTFGGDGINGRRR
jgi:hypothetical protein